MSSSSGACTFNDLKITSVGTYKLKVSSKIGAVTISNATSTFTINQALSYVSISESTTTPTAYFLFNITVDAYQANNDFYTNSASYSLTIDDSSTIGNYAIQTSSTGTYTFRIYLVSSGTRTITATVGSVTATATFNVKNEELVVILSTPVNFI